MTESSGASITFIVIGIMLVAVGLFKISSYYLNFTIYFSLLTLWATLPLPIMLLRPGDTRNTWFFAFMLRMTSKLLSIKWIVRGAHHLDSSRGSVVVINHQSSLDILALAEIYGKLPRLTTVAKRSVMLAGPFGLACILWGTLFIDRGTKDAQLSLRKQVDSIKRKNNILIFPEGTRNSAGKLLQFKKGAFHLAVEAAAPILPVLVSKFHFIDSKMQKFGSGDMILSIMPPIETISLTKEDIPTLVEKVRNLMQEEYTRINEELN